jgi:hypothetical protein
MGGTSDRKVGKRRGVKRPWHERVRLLGWLRGKARAGLFHVLRKLAATEDARRILHSALSWAEPRRAHLPLATDQVEVQPYADLGKCDRKKDPSARGDVVFITARFRSGSTLLWNLFRNVGGCTAYYEPFNERRWWDAARRGSHTDPTHRKVEDYWLEYDGLDVLGEYYDEQWTRRDLFMDEDCWNPAMKRYVDILIERAPGRPVLQFNRIDFRLPWLRHHYPRARIIHLYRHPREQWYSTLVNPSDCPRDLSVKDFAAFDHYYLREWARDLRYHFPILDESAVTHPYQLFYFIWKLSYLFGRGYASYTLAYEELAADPGSGMAGLFRAVDLPAADTGKLERLVDRPKAGKWRAYATDEWFRSHEELCEQVIAGFFRPAPAPFPPHLREIALSGDFLSSTSQGLYPGRRRSELA